MGEEDPLMGKVRHCDLCGAIIGKRLQGTRCHNCPSNEQIVKRVERKLRGEITPEMIDELVDGIAAAKQIPRKLLGFT